MLAKLSAVSGENKAHAWSLLVIALTVDGGTWLLPVGRFTVTAIFKNFRSRVIH